MKKSWSTNQKLWGNSAKLRKKPNKKIVTKRIKNLILLSVLFLSVVFFYNFYSQGESDKLGKILSNVSNSIRFASRIDPILSKEGIVLWTNFERQAEKLPILLADEDLDIIAEKRLEDMFAGQYFAHYSPTTNRGAEDEAKDINYQFISIGENLAQGYFKNEEELVRAWMNSPAHRENILKENYTRIGVAVRKGIFEGQKTWLSVQIFSRPLSECSGPKTDLKYSVENKKQELQSLVFRSQQLLKEMAEDNKRSDIGSYNQKVSIYNGIVNEINVKSEDLEKLIASYNNQVRNFNLCLQG